ncbi:hypothetical protein BC937DRAFT_90911 [Endogone sp. FLAS-F59071]|nr:hypothetical protein BC937DRAFT_90911 [Endogone sp. FLAS-F59071]|eukprot:RUS21956.1 hypothetical protein BC937DRAFT_90911 [Endogone sp. FLAS-F59071]
MEIMKTCARQGCMLPPYFERAKKLQHDYCSKTCASLAQPTCSRIGCSYPAYVDRKTGKQHPTCSRTCALQNRPATAGLCSRQSCKNPRYTSPQNPIQYYDYCTPECQWKDAISLTETKLTPLNDAQNLDYIAVKTAFEQSLAGLAGAVQAIFRIQYPSRVAAQFLAYRERSRRTRSKRFAAREFLLKRFHGTRTIMCNAVNELAKGKRTTNLCESPNCGPCGIIKRGLRGGHDNRIWSASTSAISHGYTNIFGGGNTRAMFLCDAVSEGMRDADSLAFNQVAIYYIDL